MSPGRPADPAGPPAGSASDAPLLPRVAAAAAAAALRAAAAAAAASTCASLVAAAAAAAWASAGLSCPGCIGSRLLLALRLLLLPAQAAEVLDARGAFSAAAVLFVLRPMSNIQSSVLSGCCRAEPLGIAAGVLDAPAGCCCCCTR